MSSVIDGIGYDINGGEAWVRSLERSAPWVVIPPVVMQGGKDIPVTRICKSAFRKQHCLEKVILPHSVKMIHESVFESCQNLKTVQLGESLQQIGKRAFKDCTSLEAIAIPDFVTSIGVNAFRNCEIKNVHFSKKFASRPDRDDLFNALFYAGLRTREVLLRIPTK